MGREPRRTGQEPVASGLPPRGRHRVGVARVALRRMTVARGVGVVREASRADRRREQLPLPDGFIDRRRAA